MSDKIPTPIVDKNGRNTIVHKNPVASLSVNKNKREVPVVTVAEPDDLARFRSVIDELVVRHDQKEGVEEVARKVAALPRSLSVRDVVDEMTKTEGKRYVADNLRAIYQLKEQYSEFVPTDGVNLLELSHDDPTLPKEDRFTVRAAHYIAEGGAKLIDDPDNHYGWADYALSAHLLRCYIVEVTDAREDNWSEFGDTFNGSQSYTGVSATAQCSCGYLRGEFRRGERLDEALSFFGQGY